MKHPFPAFVAVLLVPLLAGCGSPFSPPAAVEDLSQTPPEPNSPTNAVRLFEWCWRHRDPDLLAGIFTVDYTFVFGFADSAGNPYRNRPFARDDEIQSSTNLFVRGNGGLPPANSISLDFDQSMIARPDSRPGKDGKWHQEIAASTMLRIDTDDSDFDVSGHTRFFLVRGDSALIPQDLLDRGFAPDSTRWYIEQIQDETINEIAATVRPIVALPARNYSWGSALYLQPPLVARRTR